MKIEKTHLKEAKAGADVVMLKKYSQGPKVALNMIRRSMTILPIKI